MFPEHKGPVRLGVQPQTLGDSAIVVLPNPSGRNANFSHAEMLAAFKEPEEVYKTGRGSVNARGDDGVLLGVERRRPA